jgi:hypothetical protein
VRKKEGGRQKRGLMSQRWAVMVRWLDCRLDALAGWPLVMLEAGARERAARVTLDITVVHSRLSNEHGDGYEDTR